VTIIAGFVGMAMIWLDWPRPPLVLGLVLGGLIEKNLFISYSRYEFGFMLRPVLLGIIVIAVALIAAPYIQRRIAQRWRVKEEYLATQES
jgi:TctA family transporter